MTGWTLGLIIKDYRPYNMVYVLAGLSWRQKDLQGATTGGRGEGRGAGGWEGDNRTLPCAKDTGLLPFYLLVLKGGKEGKHRYHYRVLYIYIHL